MTKREALEAAIAVGNIGFFLKEFSFSRAEFTPATRSRHLLVSCSIFKAPPGSGA